MIFSLEVLQAKHGDCLILHFGNKKDPNIIVVDGGPGGVYTKYLKPRLLEIKQSISDLKPLPIYMVMISHLDDDHANGICMMFDEMVSLKEDGGKKLFKVKHAWFNTFDDIIGNIEVPNVASASASSAADESSVPDYIKELDYEPLTAVIASTSQGRQLRNSSKPLSLTVNSPFTGLSSKKIKLVRGDSKESRVSRDGIKITVVSPDQERIEKLQEKWDKDLKEAKKKGDPNIFYASISSMDTSPFNLSSIACLVEYKGKKVLLTGDGRSDHILEGLKKNKLLSSTGKLHVDILKMPHHGSIRNLSPEFLINVTADNYVISADGKHDNPDQGTLDLMMKHVRKGNVHFTNSTGENGLDKKMKSFVAKLKKQKSKIKVNFLEDPANSFSIDLLDKLNY